MLEPWPDDILAVVCMRVKTAGGSMVVPGSVQKTCSRCENAVWTSPATLESVRHMKHGFVCMECAQALADQDGKPPDVMPPSQLQIDELREHLPFNPERN